MVTRTRMSVAVRYDADDGAPSAPQFIWPRLMLAACRASEPAVWRPMEAYWTIDDAGGLTCHWCRS